MLAPVLLIYGEKTEWHFFHCLTEYGQVALFARVKSARDDIQLLLLIQTLVHVRLLPRVLLLSNRAFQTELSDSLPEQPP